MLTHRNAEIERGWFDRVEQGAYLAVAGDLADAKQCLAVRPALTGLQMPLVRQEGGALHEERGKRGEREIGHRVGRVLALPPVGQSFAVAAQSREQAILDVHPHVESEIVVRGNRENRADFRSCPWCCILDSPDRHECRRIGYPNGAKADKTLPKSKMRTAELDRRGVRRQASSDPTKSPPPLLPTAPPTPRAYQRPG